MASEGPNSPTSVVDDSAVGSSAWTNPENALASDDVRAQSSGSSHYLKATGFGFSVPDAATIDGIVVVIERRRNGPIGTSDSRVSIVKGGTVGATNKASGASWPTSDTNATYGGVADTWGETWSASDINASDFGVVLSTSGGGAQVDHIRITVHYTEGGGAAVNRRRRVLLTRAA